MFSIILLREISIDNVERFFYVEKREQEMQLHFQEEKNVRKRKQSGDL